jgi:hypothetical protein
MQGLVDQLQIVSAKDHEVLESISENMVMQIKQRDEAAKQAKQAKLDHINHCLQMVLELGVAKNSDKYYAATQLFRKSYSRHIFCHYDTPEEKLGFLQRACR